MSKKEDIKNIFARSAMRGLERLDVISQVLDKIFQDKEPVPAEISYIKDLVQKEALESVKNNENRGLVAMATGTGKSKIAVDWSKELYHNLKGDKQLRILIAVPTEKLRDENWKAEFEKWGAEWIWDSCVVRSCYVSMAKIKDQEFDLLIMDEAHNVTENNSEFFENNIVHRILALTATPPTNPDKKAILRYLKIDTVYELPLDIAVRMRIVAPYEMVIVETRLNDVDKVIKAGNKDNVFYQTEKAAYDYLSTQVKKAMFSSSPKAKAASKWKIMARMRFIYTLPSKSRAAEKILSLIPDTERVITFCGDIKQAEHLADKHERIIMIAENGDKACALDPITFHSKSSSEWFDAFKIGEVDRLTCVNALNEGQNIENLDVAFIVQLNSNALNLIQRIGRVVRQREGHKALIIVLCCVDTQDQVWTQKAIADLNSDKITYVRYENIISGNYKLYDNQ